MSFATLLLAGALLLGTRARVVRQRVGTVAPSRLPTREKHSAADPFETASALDVLSVCLSTGMTISAAARATAAVAPEALGAMLLRGADLLALGADADTAWELGADDIDEGCLALARLARRSAASGTALAAGAAELAEQEREGVLHSATAAAERAGVLIAGPLGLCFLPAFVCLGIVPVVAGLAGEIFGAGLL